MPPNAQGSRPSGYSSSTSASLSSSSFSSDSAAFDMLHQDSSQSDIISSDHFAVNNTPLPAPLPRHAGGHDPALTASRPSTNSLAVVMGQNYSKPSTSSSKGLSLTTAAANTGIKLKRAFAARRKKSEDATKLFAGNDKGKEKEWVTPAHSGASSSSSQVTSPPSKPRKATKLTLQLATQVFSGGKKDNTASPISPGPPPLPPKSPSMQPARYASSSPPQPPAKVQALQTHLRADNRGSIIPISPGISSAVHFMRADAEELAREQQLAKEMEAAKEREAAQEREAAKEKEAAKQRDAEKLATTKDKDSADKSDDQKDIWRKSDSTMSHHTIRPGAGVGSRPSRPVSMAESLQSNHTVVPVNKRLSALLTDAEFETPEEDDSSFKSASEELTPTPVPQIAPVNVSATSSPYVKNRRSMSLNLGSITTKVSLPSPPASSAGVLDDIKTPTRPNNDPYHRMTPSTSNEIPTLTRSAANGIIAPSSSGVQSTGNNIRGRLAAWTATSNSSSSSHSRHQLPHRPSPPSAFNRNTPSPQPHPHQRSTAISITSSLAPAAGLAKRAAEKLGRWGGFSSSSSGSGYSSSSSGHSSSEHALARTTSNTSSQAQSGRGKMRRTPEAPSGAWSVSSSGGGSMSDSDALSVPTGPMLGKRLRSPLRNVASGLVFGRDLVTVVKETAVGVNSPIYPVGKPSERSRVVLETPGHVTKERLKALENRRVPALVARCAQHLLLWGVGEEGLFRVSGRPSHVSKLRQEFDSGADYNMQECSPGDLDPHAVASVFKAFLRELPEPILTHSLGPYFEAALAHENATKEKEPQPMHRAAAGQRGPGLPSGPKNGLQGLRKPPSLSTLAMPNFSGMSPPSRSLLNAFKSLLAQLPPENRDLIRTVTELVTATAQEHRQTKMPLSNLLLVLCPSLNMNPPLLRMLCEAKEIWEEVDDSPVLDIKREDVVLDIKPMSDAAEVSHTAMATENGPMSPDTEHDEPLSSATTATPASPGPSEHGEDRPSFDHRRTSEERRKNGLRSKKPHGPRQAHTPTTTPISGTATGGFTGPSSSSPIPDQDLSQISVSQAGVSSDSISIHDDGASYVSTSDSRSESVASPFETGVSSPPPLSSSTESLPTPSSSSAAPSLASLPFEDASTFGKADQPGPVKIADEEILTPRRYLGHHEISAPIQFPVASGNSRPPMSPRMSAPSLSLPGLAFPGLSSPSASSPANSAPSSPRSRRFRKPSLQLLFSKRSASPMRSSSGGKPFISSPISSPYLQSPRASSDSSISTPSSVVTAPQSSTFTLPPVLDTTIESSPLRFGLGFDAQPLPEMPKEDVSGEPQETYVDEPVSVPIGETPIANRYCTPSSSTLSLVITNADADEPRPSHLRTRPTLRSKQASKQASKSSLSSTSSNHLGLLDDREDQEDWTQSVLLAADVDWRTS